MHSARLTLLLAACLSTPVYAQLVAFPGAEGAGALATGGRGGDVYRVTNLNNSGAGSLRDGITTAPASGRTIVFDVAGTIRLTSSLDISNKSKITIAGQTAPGGGITIADHRMRINNSNNIVLQHVRVRPGNTFGASDPDALWISGSNNVIVDHVTASWGVDETISVTHQSNNVTVQWSVMSQGLFNGGHSEGPNHSFGSLLNGGNYTFHHNLYTHTKSRHPRAQVNTGDLLKLNLDWVNNVVYNPGDQFGYSDSDDPFTINLVGNYGIRGPQSSATVMFNSADANSRFYVEGNYMDTNRNIVLDGSPVNGNAVFGSGHKTLVASRFGIPPVATHTAPQAYIQVLSRAGAQFRDAIDRRNIRTVFNHLPGQIQTQADWGGWPTLPTGTPQPDSNGDGVPDAWAIENGFNPAAPLHQTYSPEGYSYLEKYIHSLTPYAYTPVGTVQHTIPTSFGNGADAFVSENGGANATSGGNGAGLTLDAAWSGAGGGGGTNQAIVLRFDLSQIVPGSLTAARLDLTAASAINGTHNFMVYALEQDNERWNWDESSVQFNNAPGLAFDGNSGTLGVNNTFTTTNHPDNPGVLHLGQFSIVSSAAAGETVSLTNPNLAAFLNLAAYYQGEASQDVVTLILQQTNNVSPASFVSKEGNADFAPRLVIDALAKPISVPLLAGDYNNDGIVDAADYTVWRDALNSDKPLWNETESIGVVDAADYDAWRANFGYVANGTGGVASPASRGIPTPEPTALLLLSVAISLGVTSRRRIK